MTDVMDGKKDVVDAAVDIAGAGVKGGVDRAVFGRCWQCRCWALAATTVGTAVVAAPVIIGFTAACAVAGAVSDIFDEIFD